MLPWPPSRGCRRVSLPTEALDAPQHELTKLYTPRLDTGNPSNRPRGVQRHLLDHMPWLGGSQDTLAANAVVGSTGERADRSRTPGKGAHRRASMPGQVDRIKIRPSSTTDEQMRRRRAQRVQAEEAKSRGSKKPRATKPAAKAQGKGRSVSPVHTNSKNMARSRKLSKSTAAYALGACPST